MQVYKAITSRRTIRRFKQKEIPSRILKKLINAARLAPSAANLQPLEFIVVKDKVICNQVFGHLKWANYIAPFGNPAPDKRPTAYIAVLVNKSRAVPQYAAYDVGAACENLLLTAWGQGIGACWLQAIERKDLMKILRVPDRFSLDSIIALGYRDEMPAVEKFKGSVKYWKDRFGRLHVPKRDIDTLIHWDYF